jgi:hypothetical protein
MAAPGTGTNSIAVNGGTSNVHYGDTLTFTWSSEKLKGAEYPMIQVIAFQDVDQSGDVETEVDSGDLVFAQLNHPESEFHLAGSSTWGTNGGDATLKADLLAYSKNDAPRMLASTEEFVGYNP